ncbi:MAG: hypothetical protein HYV59_15525 [Planctomycetes bacterium]|nr:hypothetical protein [Planctomycetota bacterium]
MQLKLPFIDNNTTNVRKKNVLSSPKFGGSCDTDSKSYLKELGIEILKKEIFPCFSYMIRKDTKKSSKQWMS